MKTLSEINYSRTTEFQCAVFLNDSSAAYNVLDELLGPGGWYPENNTDAWTDIAVLNGKYYAAFGEDNVTAQSADLIYVEIEPSAGMISEYEYYNQY